MPILVPMTTGWPFASNGSSNMARRRSAKSAASVGLSIGACTTANSSPPSRATVSVSRTRSASRRATACSRASPTGCPSVSFTALN